MATLAVTTASGATKKVDASLWWDSFAELLEALDQLDTYGSQSAGSQEKQAKAWEARLGKHREWLLHSTAGFKTPNGASRAALDSARLEAGEDAIVVDARLKPLALRASTLLELDEVQAYILVQRVCGPVTDAQLAAPDTARSLLQALQLQYYVERQSLLKCVRLLLSLAEQGEGEGASGADAGTGSALGVVRMEAGKLLAQGLQGKAVSQLRQQLIAVPPKHLRRQEVDLWAEESAVEILLRLDSLFALISAKKSCDAALFLELLRLFQDHVFGRQVDSRLALTPGSERTLLQVRQLAVLVLLAGLDLESLLLAVDTSQPVSGGSETFSAQDLTEIDGQMSQLMPPQCPEHAPILMAWAVYSCLFSSLPGSDNFPAADHATYARQGYDAGAYSTLLALLGGPLFHDSEAQAGSYKSVVKTFVAGLLAAYDFAGQVEADGFGLLLDILCELYSGQEELCVELWDRDSSLDGPIRSLVFSLRQRLPHGALPLARLLAAAGEGAWPAACVYDFLYKGAPIATQYPMLSEDASLGPGSDVQLSTTWRVPGVPGVAIPAATRGRVLSFIDDSTAVVLWDSEHSGIILLLLRACHLAASDKLQAGGEEAAELAAILALLQTIVTNSKVAAESLLNLAASHAVRDATSASKLDPSLRVDVVAMICTAVDCLAQSSSPGRGSLLGACLRILTPFARRCPQAVARQLSSTRLFQPGSAISTLRGLSSAMASEEGLLCFGHMALEQASGSYDLTLPVLDLLQALLERGATCQLAALLTRHVAHSIVPNYGSWRFSAPHLQWQIASKAVQVLQAALETSSLPASRGGATASNRSPPVAPHPTAQGDGFNELGGGDDDMALDQPAGALTAFDGSDYLMGMGPGLGAGTGAGMGNGLSGFSSSEFDSLDYGLYGDAASDERHLASMVEDLILADSTAVAGAFRALGVDGRTFEEMERSSGVGSDEVAWLQLAIRDSLDFLTALLRRVAAKGLPAGQVAAFLARATSSPAQMPHVAAIASFSLYTRNEELQVASLMATTQICEVALSARHLSSTVASFLPSAMATQLRGALGAILTVDPGQEAGSERNSGAPSLFSAGINFLLVSLDTQPTLIELLLFPQEADNKFEDSGTPSGAAGAASTALGTTPGSAADSADATLGGAGGSKGKGAGVLSPALAAMWKIVQRSSEFLESSPEVLSRVLHALAAIWQHAVEYYPVVAALREQPGFWPGVSACLLPAPGPTPSDSLDEPPGVSAAARRASHLHNKDAGLDAEYDFGLGLGVGLELSQTDKARVNSAFRLRCQASVLRLMSLDVFLHRQLIVRPRGGGTGGESAQPPPPGSASPVAGLAGLLVQKVTAGAGAGPLGGTPGSIASGGFSGAPGTAQKDESTGASAAVQVLSEWRARSKEDESALVARFARCHYREEPMQRAKAGLRVLVVGLMVKLTGGDIRGLDASLALRVRSAALQILRQPAAHELTRQYSSHVPRSSGSREQVQALILHDLYHHLLGDLEGGRPVPPGPFRQLASYLAEVKAESLVNQAGKSHGRKSTPPAAAHPAYGDAFVFDTSALTSALGLDWWGAERLDGEEGQVLPREAVERILRDLARANGMAAIGDAQLAVLDSFTSAVGVAAFDRAGQVQVGARLLSDTWQISAVEGSLGELYDALGEALQANQCQVAPSRYIQVFAAQQAQLLLVLSHWWSDLAGRRSGQTSGQPGQRSQGVLAIATPNGVGQMPRAAGSAGASQRDEQVLSLCASCVRSLIACLKAAGGGGGDSYVAALPAGSTTSVTLLAVLLILLERATATAQEAGGTDQEGTWRSPASTGGSSGGGRGAGTGLGREGANPPHFYSENESVGGKRVEAKSESEGELASAMWSFLPALCKSVADEAYRDLGIAVIVLLVRGLLAPATWLPVVRSRINLPQLLAGLRAPPGESAHALLGFCFTLAKTPGGAAALHSAGLVGHLSVFAGALLGERVAEAPADEVVPAGPFQVASSPPPAQEAVRGRRGRLLAELWGASCTLVALLLRVLAPPPAGGGLGAGSDEFDDFGGDLCQVTAVESALSFAASQHCHIIAALQAPPFNWNRHTPSAAHAAHTLFGRPSINPGNPHPSLSHMDTGWAPKGGARGWKDGTGGGAGGLQVYTSLTALRELESAALLLSEAARHAARWTSMVPGAAGECCEAFAHTLAFLAREGATSFPPPGSGARGGRVRCPPATQAERTASKRRSSLGCQVAWFGVAARGSMLASNQPPTAPSSFSSSILSSFPTSAAQTPSPTPASATPPPPASFFSPTTPTPTTTASQSFLATSPSPALSVPGGALTTGAATPGNPTLQKDKSVDAPPPSEYSDEIAMCVYRTILHGLQLACALASTAVARSVERVPAGGRPPELPPLPSPEVLHGLQDQAIAVATDILSGGGNRAGQPEGQQACVLMLDIVELCLMLEACVVRSYAMCPSPIRRDDVSSSLAALAAAVASAKRPSLAARVKAANSAAALLFETAPY